MRDTLVGSTGFVGSNLKARHEFSHVYHRTDIAEAYGTRPDLLIYAGLRAEKYLANNAPEKDMEQIIQAEHNIEKIKPDRLVLISTIDVFKTPKGVNENSMIDTEGLHAYGYNRYRFEQWVRENYQKALIVRLPGLFGENIKKNFIYDYINVIPSMLKAEKFRELSARDSELKKYYHMQDNGFYKVNVPATDRNLLKERFKSLGFSALYFTDSRSRYQFYDLSRLYDDIQIALKAGLMLWHPATEPVSAGEVYRYLTGQDFINEIPGIPADYDYKTVYYNLFRGRNGYIADKKTVLQDIKDFTEREK